MADAITFLPSLTAFLLLGFVVLPSCGLANRNPRVVRQWVTAIAAVQALFGWVALGWIVLSKIGESPTQAVRLPLMELPGTPLAATIYLDGVSSLMFCLVASIGWVICRYSIRYLDGEPNQGAYFCWVGTTLGSVSLFILSGNLALMWVSWIVVGFGLHQLLLHYRERPAAGRAAWSKFTVSRMGDAAFAAAIVLVYRTFGTLDLPQLFELLKDPGLTSTPAVQAIGGLLAVAAAMKSAQLPFHTWVPQSLETPTPVSALMHAGIINAGGYLIIRTSPLVALSPVALSGLAILGGLTAGFAALVMMTQTSVKKSLAYSTIAQMGFMMLQCGLGAYAAAMLHLLAHSLYKAHAFLSSGSVIDRSRAVHGSRPGTIANGWSGCWLMAAAVLAGCVAMLALLGVDPLHKPGGLLLAAVLSLALTDWLARVRQIGDTGLLVRAIGVSAGLCALYATAYRGIDFLVSPNVASVTSLYAGTFVLIALALTFSGLWTLQTLAAASRSADWLRPWYVHASNGFYLDELLRRILVPLRSS
ncbi:oxidoreductase [Roseiconus nitratireducens]|uniref:Probable inorganic carbon transporter subunit DabB n=1 Tax=Roseiconus nitratireducens TaxID=2605748 RepID=A0A5M6DEX5_9BACT|nr:proton-conducting transporter membrane subunit [Roseiconus nitratireducens]KAA5546111.1 oxidoreductase [Roseiconus nitratireducens]